MTCAQGLLRLLWGGGPEVVVLRDWAPVHGTGFKKYRGTGTVLFEKLLNQYTTLA